MSSGIFGPRGPSTPSFYPYANYQYAPQQYQYQYQYQYRQHQQPLPSAQHYPQQPFQTYPLQSYPQQTLQTTEQQVFSPNSFPYSGQSTNLFPYLTSYPWSPEPVASSKGLESILIAILVLVVLDTLFIRPLKSPS